MGLLDKISKYVPVYRRCPANRLHRVTSESGDCGHTGRVLEWCEPYHKWVGNPTKTAVAKDMFENDEEFEIEKEARLKLEEAMRNGDLQPALDYRKKIMGEL